MFDKKKYLEKYQKVPVIEYKNNVCQDPLVSVLVQTYQQVNYIGKCLDGILEQQTNFQYEILVGEDDSSDGTRAICLEYAKKFPNKIKLFLHSRANNITVYGEPSALFNAKYNLYNASGKYIAICEGDDFWLDPLKLQKQVDFLESNQDYGLVFSDIVRIDEKGKVIQTTDYHKRKKALCKSGSIFWDLLDSNFINTLTVCARKKIFLNYLYSFDNEYSYDYSSWLYFASNSKIKYIDEKWASYRIHLNGMSRLKNFGDKRKPLVRQSALINYLSINNYNSSIINRYVFSKTVNFILKNKSLQLKEKKPIITLFIKYPKFLFYILSFYLNRSFSKILNKFNGITKNGNKKNKI